MSVQMNKEWSRKSEIQLLAKQYFFTFTVLIVWIDSDSLSTCEIYSHYQ